ncbi:MAG: Gfo/Idh/MocA family oxidoreductase [Devosia sp.]
MADRKVRWGIVSTANIGVKKVIPGIMKSPHSEVVALGSRDAGKARAALDELGLTNARAYGNYAELYSDPDIDAIYNPLPNHLHVPETLAAAKAGKHVLCEKPIGLDVADAERLRAIPKNVLVTEAFMVRYHPQWMRAREIAASGELGTVHAIRAVFTYFLDDPSNVRNIADIGGGGIMDVGCYPVVASRYIFGAEPKRVVALVDRDPNFKTDRLASVIADYGNGRQLSFICGTQSAGNQKVEIIGTKGRAEVIVPFNALPDERSAIEIDTGAPFDRSLARREIIRPVDQYTEQAEHFALAVLGEKTLPWGIEDAIAQMKVLDAIFKSEKTGAWADV